MILGPVFNAELVTTSRRRRYYLARLVYGATDPKAGACESLFRLVSDSRLNHRVPITAGVLARECGDVLKEFFQERRDFRKLESCERQ